jgi:hypothetical protein
VAIRSVIEQRLRDVMSTLGGALELGGTLAQRVITQLISDLSGDDIDEGRGETVEFAYRGNSYTIDLTDKEAAGFDRAMAMYIEHATKVGGVRQRPAASAKASGAGRSKDELQNVRTWARENGYQVSERGRIKADIVAAYHSAD